MDITVAVPVFLVTTVIIGIAGTFLTRSADQLADLTGLGEAMVGAILLGGVTSLSGIMTSVTAAYEGYPELAVSNAMGGIAAQTAFLAIADITYTKSNLEHASASLSNLMQGVLLMVILTFVLVIKSAPEVTIAGVHPGSVIILIMYVWGQWAISRAKEDPLWRPIKTRETVQDLPDHNYTKLDVRIVWGKFVLLALITAGCGYAVAKSGIVIAYETGLSETFVGNFLTAVVTSLPELIVALAAVRQKALTMAVSNIIGGNTFDVMFVSFADFAFLKGSILHSVTPSQVFTVCTSLMLTGILLFGMLFREKHGIGRIGWESFLILLIYIGSNLVLFFTT